MWRCRGESTSSPSPMTAQNQSGKARASPVKCSTSRLDPIPGDAEARGLFVLPERVEGDKSPSSGSSPWTEGHTLTPGKG